MDTSYVILCKLLYLYMFHFPPLQNEYNNICSALIVFLEATKRDAVDE